MRSSLHGALTAAALVLLPAQLAVGQDPSETNATEAQAREHFEVGRRLYDLGQFPEAAAAFERAYDLSERPALLMNMYLAYRDAARPRAAADALRRYLQTAEVSAEERQTLEVRLRALERQVEEAPTDGAGDPAVEPTAGGEADLTGPAILLGAGGAVLLAGVGTGIGAAIEHDALAVACPDQRCEPAEAGRIDTVRGLTIATDVLIGVGVAAAGAGLVWLLVELLGGENAAASETAWRVAPACGGTGCSVTMEGSL